jgi:hypothetical protein
MPREARYVFGRFNLIANYPDKRDYIHQGLTTEKSETSRGSKWIFLQAEELETPIGWVITGYLVKYKPSRDVETVDENAHNFADERIDDPVDAKSRFFLHVDSGLIAYNPVVGKISDSTFRERFANLFERAHDNLFVDAEIQAISDEEAFFTALKNFTKISRFKVQLHPSNPSISETWKHIHERLKKLEVSKYREDISIRDDGNGFGVRDDPDIEAKIRMAQDGYGRASVRGRVNNTSKSIHTSKEPISAVITKDPEEAQSIFERLIDEFKKILDRIK